MGALYGQYRATAIALAAVIVLTGCGVDDPIARVSGSVTYEGSPVAEGLVIFSNEQRGVYITAEISNGSYEVVTSQGDGLPLGAYQVAITPPIDEEVFGPIDRPPRPAAHSDIPPHYRSARDSGFSVELVDGDNRADFTMVKAAGKK